jgi:hypothetical protein
MYIKVVDQRIKKDLPVGWTNQNRGHGRFDTLSPALVLSNSEVGAGALSVRTSVYFGGCTNLTVIREGAVRKYHVGGKHDVGDQVYALLSETTKKLTDAAIWSTVKDVVAGAFDQAHFDAVVAKMEDATKQKIDAGVVNEIVEITGDRYGFNENEKSGILRHLIEGGDLSRYGLHNAVTRMSADLDNYDRATQVEELGGDIIELAPNDWKKICEEATA